MNRRSICLSAAMAVQFADAVRELTETVRQLGPNLLGDADH